jgi:hypothetical protein
MSLTSSPIAFEPLSAAEIDQLIGAVADRHGFLLDRQDPVLATVTLSELAIARLLGEVGRTVALAKHDIGAGAEQQVAAAKDAASHLITQAAEYADQQFRLAAEAAVDEIKKGFLKELTGNPLVIEAERVTSAASNARWSMSLAFLALALTALIAIGFPLLVSHVPQHQACASSVMAPLDQPSASYWTRALDASK